jgi:hypothetical protein
VVRFTAKNIGFLWAAILRLQEDFDKKWLGALKEWQAELDKFYTYFAAHRFGVDRRKRVNLPNDGNHNNRQEDRTNGNGSLKARVDEYLRQAGFRPSEIGDGPEFRMKPSAIADALQLSPKERNQIHINLKRLRDDETSGKWSMN